MTGTLVGGFVLLWFFGAGGFAFVFGNAVFGFFVSGGSKYPPLVGQGVSTLAFCLNPGGGLGV